MKTILILGANSGMARALARQLTGPDVQLILTGRRTAELEQSASDLAIRSVGPKPIIMPFDAEKPEQHEAFLAGVLRQTPVLDEVYLFFGQMAPQAEAQQDFAKARRMIEVNYLGAVSILERVAAVMETAGRGLIVGVSSVAGDRGRQSNYIYGSTKAALSAYLQGLRNRLAKRGVHVMTIKPGFVDTPMTRDLKKGLLVASPEQVAKGILAAVRKKKDVAYVPGFWWPIMSVIRAVPEGVFKKLKL